MSKLLSGNVISQKFILKEVIIFLLNERIAVLGDSGVSFTVAKLKKFIYKTKNISTTNKKLCSIVKSLETFKKRDEDGNEIEPRKQLLKYAFQNKKIKITNCSTGDLRNILRYIIISIYLKKRPSEYKNRSLYSLTHDGKLEFLDEYSDRPLGMKEKAIFSFLRRNFRKKCNYKDIFDDANKARRGSNRDLNIKNNTEPKKRTYINNGIKDLRKKIFEVSSNAHAISTKEGRESIYILKY